MNRRQTMIQDVPEGVRRALVLAAAIAGVLFCGVSPAFGAFTGHEPLALFGTLTRPSGLAIDQSTGNVFVLDGGGPEVVRVFDSNGNAIGVIAGTPQEHFQFFGSEPVGVAVDNACYDKKLEGSSCTSFDPSNGDLYVPDVDHSKVDKFALNNGIKEYEYVGNLSVNGPVGAACDSQGDVYVVTGRSVIEYDPAGNVLETFSLGSFKFPQRVAVDAKGDIYVWEKEGIGGELVKLTRSSLTGPAEGEAIVDGGVTGVAFDYATERLLVDYKSVAAERDPATYESLGEFGAGRLSYARELAVNETSGDVYLSDAGIGHVQEFDTFSFTTPLASTGETSNVGRTAAQIEGTIHNGGVKTTYHFEYGTTTAYGSMTPTESLEEGTVGRTVTAVLDGLEPGVTYHYALVATNLDGTTVGADQAFTAQRDTPTATTSPPTAIGPETATIAGIVNSGGLATTYAFEMETGTEEYGPPTGLGGVGAGESAAQVTLNLENLQPDTTYHYRLTATNIDGTSRGDQQTFTTPAIPESILATQAALPLLATPIIPIPTIGKPSRPKPSLTKEQKLKKALKACHKKHHKQRISCERAARGSVR